MKLKTIFSKIQDCQVCHDLPCGIRPVVQGSETAKIAIIGQAPGIKVHNSGVPWDDASGNRLREWLGLSNEQFYDKGLVSIVPMGFCYPGKGKSGDLPPRKECAPQWHNLLLSQMNSIKLTLLIGSYSQRYYLPKVKHKTLQFRVKNWRLFYPDFICLPHPSPRNISWFKNNPWFEQEALTEMKKIVQDSIL